MMWIKPRVGLKIRDPFTQRHLPEEGMMVDVNRFWLRRLEEGDVIEVATPSVTSSIEFTAERSGKSKEKKQEKESSL